jgi:predicted acyl esterase
VLSHLIERFLHLDPPLTRDLAVRRDLRVPMPDGAVLLADLWAPRISTASRLRRLAVILPVRPARP